MRRIGIPAAALGLAALAGCVPRPAPPPPVPQAEPVRPAPAPAPPPAAPPADWRDASLSPGGWTFSLYGGRPQATFGPAGAPSFLVRCEAGGRVSLARIGATAGNVLALETSYGERRLPATVEAGPRPALVASVPAGDPLLDSVAFSRGRFAVSASGVPMLILPAWPEPARVVEECRGRA